MFIIMMHSCVHLLLLTLIDLLFPIFWLKALEISLEQSIIINYYYTIFNSRGSNFAKACWSVWFHSLSPAEVFIVRV